MGKSKLLLIVSAFLALFGSAWAQTSLEVAIRDALANNPGLRAEAERLNAAEQAISQARAAGLPAVSFQGVIEKADGSYDPGEQGQALISGLLPPNAGDNSALSDFGGTDRRQAQLSVTQPLFTGFRIKNGIKEAKASVEAARAGFEATKNGYALRIADAYLSVVTAKTQQGVVESSLASITSQEKAARIAFEVGQNTKTDLALAQARLAAVRAQQAQTQSANIAAQANYLALTGKEPPDIVLEDAALPVPENAERAIATGLANNPELRAAVAMAEASAAAERAAKGERAPSVRLRGSVSYGENNFLPGDVSENATLAAEMEMPLFQGGAISANVRAATAEARASRFAVTDLQRQVEAQIRATYSEYQAAIIGREAAKAQLDAADLAYRGVVLEQEVGQRSILDVLQVEEDLQAARLNSIAAQRNVILASYQLRSLMGTLISD